ncbi:hypothetical protein FCL47_23600 [Desulfopila sp. IMCC35006]|uniref:hypothetical protein n=1 Tax=Desulfopila sp. IMCC35006 TaxID=2569542 RepID=UPI0010AC8392|nr:hypothetical protein [Desulfopila sp. IMCC35006]TKB23201.1 hypothetical protein FCL47_23600 [Desulfopila sp. IMCC35006]
MEKLKEYFIGDFVQLNIVRNLKNEELWNLVYQYWSNIAELNFKDENQIDLEWQKFKTKGIVAYKPSDEGDVKAIALSLRKAVKKFISFKNVFIGDHIRLNILLDQDRKEGIDILYKYFHKLIGLRLYDPNDIVTSDYVEGQWYQLKKTGVITYRQCDEKEAKKIINELQSAIREFISF